MSKNKKKSFFKDIEESSAFQKAKRKAQKIVEHPEELSHLADQVLHKVGRITGQTEKMSEMSRMLKGLVRMVLAYARGDYRAMPVKSLVVMVIALIYFIMPIDLIPDFIPITGFLDDLTVLYMVFNSLKKDIEAFEEWESGNITIEE